MVRPTCPNIIDVEASGFGGASYPIEIGIAMSDGERYCSLIRPIQGWEHWDEKAEALHGISRNQLLERGKSPIEVCLELNKLLDGQVVYTDAWVVDKPWVTTLYAAASVDLQFDISPIESIQTECQHDHWDEIRKKVFENNDQERHRASIDAHLIQTIYTATRDFCETGSQR